ncbi:MAG: hypothetical protein J7545_16220 [Roseofilum sp. SBFL]|uniref:hypothetical protein n=1 Tax=unclassified Roseofilum TaxID=2620099 RepID=UPI001B243437|nr:MULTISPECIES: hypothetical protein [unclassified Roseofilum]MBP0012765.1 hypothetical protein [Roseofilum sp. SID3]MBP0026261.1 hypothetical protein [Roseofilum sp. SID2]MBP0037080.1 hypothetical protein [Roseofilum sp. SID1]MBP0043493.1 hypothetical protein [Roseofilum sp. SBFL]
MNDKQFDRILEGLNSIEQQVLDELLNGREIATTVASNKSDVQKIRRDIYKHFGVNQDDGRRRGRFFLIALFFRYKPELVNLPCLKNFQSMSAENFEQQCDRLSPQEKPVLEQFLQNKTDEQIAASLNKKLGTKSLFWRDRALKRFFPLFFPTSGVWPVALTGRINH